MVVTYFFFEGSGGVKGLVGVGWVKDNFILAGSS